MLCVPVIDLLSKCTSLKNQAPDKSWNKFRENKNKFKASRRRNSIKNIKKTDAFSRGYCLGYITISGEFTENTIYRGFIEFCNFNTDFPINNKLVEYCITKSDDYDKNKSLEENIEILKKEGKTYSLDSFNNLLNAVNKMNIVHLNLNHKYPSSITHMRDLIQHMIETDNSIGNEFLNLFKNILDSYDIENTEDNKDVRNLRNYLGENIEILENDIINYITNYANLSKNEKKKYNRIYKKYYGF